MQVQNWIRRIGTLLGRRRRLLAAMTLAILLTGPLVTSDGEAVLLNAVGLGLGALLVLRLARLGSRNRTTTRRRKS